MSPDAATTLLHSTTDPHACETICWQVSQCPPGERDEAGEPIPPGWYITAYGDDEPEDVRAIVYVMWSANGDGRPVDEELARHLYALLTARGDRRVLPTDLDEAERFLDRAARTQGRAAERARDEYHRLRRDVERLQPLADRLRVDLDRATRYGQIKDPLAELDTMTAERDELRARAGGR